MTDDAADDTTLITIAPSVARRYLGVLSIGVIGVLFLTIAFEADGLWTLMFLGFAIVAILAAERLWRSTGDSIVLTRTELRTGSGRILTPVANVKAVDRGAFAFKPSNGFLVRLHEPCGSGWAPGLWWQRGRLIGVGGVIPGGQARAMAELLTALQQGTVKDLL
ncbi:MAG: hypothetical protein QNJ20_12965 [Paracoccaceae bacterium]|nr:hypothetical protein [Paracoccaceae bacterium]